MLTLDLSRKTNLTSGELLELCSAMQAVFLEEVFKETGWGREEAIFHGGTSLNVAWGSPRFSEDLDFMVNRDSLDELGRYGKIIFARVQRRLLTLTPGAEIAFNMKPQRPGRDRMDVWDIRWTHPMRHGTAKVKAEFYAVMPEFLERYRSVDFVTLPNSTATVRITAPIPVGDLVSLWGDKVKAIATRQAFKFRDAHDLGYIATQFENQRPSNEELQTALCLSGEIYTKTPDELIVGLKQRCDEGVSTRKDEFLTDMKRWFGEDAFKVMQDSKLLTSYWERTLQEMLVGLDLLENLHTKKTFGT